MIKHIFKYISPNSVILIAYSGGLDSTVLLYQFIKLKKKHPNLKIKAIHINHNLNINSNFWSIHCKQQCDKNNIPIIIKSIYIPTQNRNIESQSRKKRYFSIKQEMLPNEILVTGHHSDDQCETILLALKRGSGPSGLKGILECYSFGTNKIIRPLLRTSRFQIKKWALQKKIFWIQDESNLDSKFDRNFLRLQIIPVLQKRWPNFSKNCSKTAYICSNNEIIIDSLSKKLLSKYLLPNNSLNITNFNVLSKVKLNIILRYWIYKQTNKRISYSKTRIIDKEVINSKLDKNPKLIFYKYEIRRYKNCIFCLPYYPSIRKLMLFWYHPWNYLKLPFNLGKVAITNKGTKIIAPLDNELVNIRFQFNGKISIKNRLKRKKLKKIWQELKVPPWNRERVPLLFYNNKFIAALGFFIVNRKTNINDKYWNLLWIN